MVDSVHRPGHGRGARERLQETQHQNFRETFRTQARGLDDGPDDTRGKRYARKNRVPLPQSDAAARATLRSAIVRGRLRLFKPGQGGEKISRKFERESRLGCDRVSDRAHAAALEIAGST